MSFYGAVEALTLTDTIVMVDSETYNVNIRIDGENEDGEIMVPYSRVLLIAWDKDAGIKLKKIRNSKNLTRPALAKLTNGVVSEPTVVALEFGHVKSVSREKLDALLSHLDSDVRSLFPTATIKDFQEASD